MADSAVLGRGPSRLPTAVSGDGCWLIDADGRRYLDGSGGAAVSCLGHSDAHVRAAVHAQLDKVAFAHTGFFTTDAAERLAAKLIETAPPGITRVYPLTGGSEAVEAALKLARQYFLEVSQPQRAKIVARRQSYHGNTLGALAAGGNAWRREKYAPLLVECHHVSPCYPYREQGDDSDTAYVQRLADELETKFQELGPDTVMAFVAEPVVGATAGALAPLPGYFMAIRQICDRHGVLLILDEVMCGMGRTGTLFACEQDGVAPDIVTIAKGLGAGYAPIGAMLLSDRIHRAIADGSGSFQHGHTYHGHPLAAAAGLAVLERLVDDGLVACVNRRGERLMEALNARLGQHPHVGDIRGRGLFRGIELVADRETKTPFDPARKLHAQVKKAAMAEGLICYPAGGTVDGVHGDHILLAPPFIISDDEIDMLADRLTRAIDTALAA
ncbi:Adenosylmethionine-8-amino-7-oxononanoate aminotransferase [Rhodobacteraceae bacterium THAF1]|uniref:aspartate aminotransferase family protein n=1 Tax=Palleronia sp. THAF1 TaxID=2587842 RepID=UPI000F3F3A05|nr:aspartate aminotransferase family protein [Palleronia sp. THAF1]QFU08137.1 Adenosylmethionine-8-amino-7-oxononanoate aminotransferase [Palleronia sp. THAF1]VDC28687.1 Adenosylmethionine-8-amino-7-oxononanoate aminotransferase [Rhodobacteraceae bacterium THAF1]